MGDWQAVGGKKKKHVSRPALSKEDMAFAQHAEVVRSFKTWICRVNHGQDREAARRCPGIHDWEDKAVIERRPPFEFPYYEAEFCIDADACERGPQCPFAHTQFEMMFHPTRCKTTLCKDGSACKHIYQCAFAHSTVDMNHAQSLAATWLDVQTTHGRSKVGLGQCPPSARSIGAFVESVIPELEPQPAVPSSPESRLFKPAAKVAQARFEHAFDPWQSDLLHGARGKKLQDEIQRYCAKGSVPLTATFTMELIGWQLALNGPADDEFDTRVAECLQRIESVWWSRTLLPRSEKSFPPRFIRFLSQHEGLVELVKIRKKWSLDGALVLPGGALKQEVQPHTVVLWGSSDKARISALHDLDLLLAGHRHSAEREQQDAQLHATQQELSRLRFELDLLREKHDALQIEHQAVHCDYATLQEQYSKLDSKYVASKREPKAVMPSLVTSSVVQRKRSHQYWDDDECPTDGRCALIVLDEDSEEYDCVRSHFIASFSGRVASMRIERVQNRSLFDLYLLKKSQMTTPNEKWLFHGSDARAVQSMCQTGFNRSYAGKNAIAFGKGCYFALNSRYSNQYAGRDCATQSRRIIVAWVAIGKHCDGNSTMCAPKEGYDTTSNAKHKVGEPTIFVTYNDAQSYPAYVVTYHTE